MTIFGKVWQKFRQGGFRGVRSAIMRRVFSPSVHPVEVAIDAITEKAGFAVVQLGAFVGKTSNDPLFEAIGKRLREGQGKLVVVEPVKCYFDELVNNYRNIPGVAFENVAIADRSGPATFYRLGVDPVAYGHPEWLSQLGSLKKERMTELWDKYEGDKTLKEFYLANQVEEIVECITFPDLMSRHNLREVDLLQIDVEGYELEILRTIDFNKFPTRFVNYECVLLHEKRADAESLMSGWGYRLIDYNQDTFCYKRSDKQLAKLWRTRGKSLF